jgi:hypothetical protein
LEKKDKLLEKKSEELYKYINKILVNSADVNYKYHTEPYTLGDYKTTKMEIAPHNMKRHSSPTPIKAKINIYPCGIIEILSMSGTTVDITTGDFLYVYRKPLHAGHAGITSNVSRTSVYKKDKDNNYIWIYKPYHIRINNSNDPSVLQYNGFNADIKIHLTPENMTTIKGKLPTDDEHKPEKKNITVTDLSRLGGAGPGGAGPGGAGLRNVVYTGYIYLGNYLLLFENGDRGRMKEYPSKLYKVNYSMIKYNKTVQVTDIFDDHRVHDIRITLNRGGTGILYKSGETHKLIDNMMILKDGIDNKTVDIDYIKRVLYFTETRTKLPNMVAPDSPTEDFKRQVSQLLYMNNKDAQDAKYEYIVHNGVQYHKLPLTKWFSGYVYYAGNGNVVREEVEHLARIAEQLFADSSGGDEPGQLVDDSSGGAGIGVELSHEFIIKFKNTYRSITIDPTDINNIGVIYESLNLASSLELVTIDSYDSMIIMEEDDGWYEYEYKLVPTIDYRMTRDVVKTELPVLTKLLEILLPTDTDTIINLYKYELDNNSAIIRYNNINLIISPINEAANGSIVIVDVYNSICNNKTTYMVQSNGDYEIRYIDPRNIYNVLYPPTVGDVFETFIKTYFTNIMIQIGDESATSRVPLRLVEAKADNPFLDFIWTDTGGGRLGGRDGDMYKYSGEKTKINKQELILSILSYTSSSDSICNADGFILYPVASPSTVRAPPDTSVDTIKKIRKLYRGNVPTDELYNNDETIKSAILTKYPVNYNLRSPNSYQDRYFYDTKRRALWSTGDKGIPRIVNKDGIVRRGNKTTVIFEDGSKLIIGSNTNIFDEDGPAAAVTGLAPVAQQRPRLRQQVQLPLAQSAAIRRSAGSRRQFADEEDGEDGGAAMSQRVSNTPSWSISALRGNSTVSSLEEKEKPHRQGAYMSRVQAPPQPSDGVQFQGTMKKKGSGTSMFSMYNTRYFMLYNMHVASHKSGETVQKGTLLYYTKKDGELKGKLQLTANSIIIQTGVTNSGRSFTLSGTQNSRPRTMVMKASGQVYPKFAAAVAAVTAVTAVIDEEEGDGSASSVSTIPMAVIGGAHKICE